MAKLVFFHCLVLILLYAEILLQSQPTWLEHLLCEWLPVEGVVGGGEEVAVDVLAVHDLARGGQQHRVLHQLAHHRVCEDEKQNHNREQFR